MLVFNSVFCFCITLVLTLFECGGSLIVPGTNPYQVAILRRVDFNFDVLDGLKFVCGGSLIAPQWVLTSAQCVEYPNLKIKLGVNNIRRYERFHMAFDITEENIRVHPKYTKGAFNNDVGLIKLPSKVEFNQYIQPVALPLEHSGTYVNETVFISGWSRASPFTPVPDFLRQATVKVLDNERCQASYLSPLIYITCNHMCTSGGGWLSAISCSGDAGAPLIHFNRKLSRPEQVGIALRSTSDCEGKPMLYTKIGPYKKWIADTVSMASSCKNDTVDRDDKKREVISEEEHSKAPEEGTTTEAENVIQNDTVLADSNSNTSTERKVEVTTKGELYDGPKLGVTDQNQLVDPEVKIETIAENVKDALEKDPVLFDMHSQKSTGDKAEVITEGDQDGPELNIKDGDQLVDLGEKITTAAGNVRDALKKVPVLFGIHSQKSTEGNAEVPTKGEADGGPVLDVKDKVEDASNSFLFPGLAKSLLKSKNKIIIPDPGIDLGVEALKNLK